MFTRANDQRWETKVATLNGNKLALGLADGWATAAVLETAGSYECYPWKVDGLQVTEQEVVVSAGNSAETETETPRMRWLATCTILSVLAAPRSCPRQERRRPGAM